MEKLGLLKNEKMGNYEKEQGRASYKTIVDQYIGDIVLCNNIIDIDTTIYDNINENGFTYIDYKTGEEKTKEEYDTDNSGNIEIEYNDIYQYYLCNISDYEKEQAKKAGLILSYSDVLDCDVLCVDHYGTRWDYVLTDVKLFDNYEALTKWENEESEDQQ